jgi:hypothetical protein
VFTSEDCLSHLSRLSQQPAASGAQPADWVDPDSVQGRRQSAAAQLGVYLHYLYGQDGQATRPTELASRLFDLYAAQRAMLPVGADVDQPVELIQISSDTRSLLDIRRRTAQSKLTGLQLHHFGAFYKPSWRANDWMWGRLDGAGWLVHLLLDPRRIQAIAQDNADQGKRVDWLLGQLRDRQLVAGAPPGIDVAGSDAPKKQVLDEEAIRAELSYLDIPTKPIPPSLPLTALWVAETCQHHIAVEELPHVAAAVLTSAEPGKPKKETAQSGNAIPAPARQDGLAPAAAQWAVEVNTAQMTPGGAGLDRLAPALLRNCPVPEESLSTEVGTPLLTRTVTKAAATTSAAVNSIKQAPSVVRPVLSSLRTVTLTGYRATNVTTPTPRRLILIGLAMLIVGVIAATQQTVLFGIAGLALAAAGAYLIAIGAWGTSMRLFASLFAITLLGAIAALAAPVVRRGLFGTSTKDTGVVGREVHWVGSSWWHPLIVVAVILLAFALVIVALDPRRRRSTNREMGSRRRTVRQASRSTSA